MKCKSWSNKINNFVVRRLKSIKINGTQQPPQSIINTTTASTASTAVAAAATSSNATTTTTTKSTLASNCVQQQEQQLQQQQHCNIATSGAGVTNTMPAMPKEKSALAVSLNESNFAEFKLKELAVVAAMATTATIAASAGGGGSSRNQQQQQQQQQQMASTCGCGAASAAATTSSSATATETTTIYNDSGINNNICGSSRFLTTNGHSSPLAAAAATQQQQQRQNRTCCRMQYQNGLQQQQQQQHQQQQQNLTVDTTAAATAEATSAAASSPSAAAAPVTPPRRSPNDFIFGRYIGEGSFSNVYLAVDIHTRREYAIKVCEKRHILREHKQEYIRREREVMHMMTNVPGFVNLSCTFQDTRSLYFVMTYAKKGDLLPYINKVGSFDVDCTRHYAAELLLACEQMHRRNVVHRDLKPENILLDEDMHTLIADFGSAKIMTPAEREQAANRLAAGVTGTRQMSRASDEDDSEDHDDDDDDDDDEVDDDDNADDDDDDVDDVDNVDVEPEDEDAAGNDVVDGTAQRGTRWRSTQRAARYQRKRRASFVGTAQYVSPEVLKNGVITPAADLWALGCIVYQMISGLPPFRGANDYVIFKEILNCKVDFPQGFDKDAKDLVRRLLKVNPHERLGAQDEFGCYESIRAHPFFASVDWRNLRQMSPPPIYPYLPGVSKDEDFRSHYRVPENLKPGLDERQITRLLGIELGVGGCESHSSKTTGAGGDTVNIEKKTAKNSFDLSYTEKLKRLEQQKADKWSVFADGEVILKKGFVNKRKGLFARRRMLLLTTGPRLIYIDPVQMVKKGEIPWSPELRVEAKNFKIFFVHTPNRTYYLDDPEGYSLEWVDAIEKMRTLAYNTDHTAATSPQQKSKNLLNASSSATTTTTSTSSSSSTTATTSATISSSSAAATSQHLSTLPKATKIKNVHSAMTSVATAATATVASLKTSSN